MPKNPIDYARAPEPMSRKRLSLVIGTAAAGCIVVGGVTYVLGQPATQPVIRGDMVAPTLTITTQPTTAVIPGTSPTTQQWKPLPDKSTQRP